MHQTDLETFFKQLAAYSKELMDRLPIAREIEPIRATFSRLKPALEQKKAEEVSQMPAMPALPDTAVHDEQPAGMNTVGILADRLTILVCKWWYLRNRQQRMEDAAEIEGRQIPAIVKALALARPGDPRLLEKVSIHHAAVQAAGFQEAYYGILAANILMWETQEMLYIKDMEQVPPDELRDYIRFFTEANMMRNAYISQSEYLYWKRGV